RLLPAATAAHTEVRGMPRDATGGQGMSKPEMIQEVLTDAPDLPAPKVRAAVWDRYGGEVTAREIAGMRKKLRQPAEHADAAPRAKPRPEVAERKPAARVRRRRLSHTARKKGAAGAVRAKDFKAAEVTVKQLSAILE